MQITKDVNARAINMTHDHHQDKISRIEVVKHDPKWAHMYEDEAQKILGVLGESAVAIHHMGSTSIPGVQAKPIIDILVEVDKLENIEKFDQELEGLDYLAMGEYGITGRRFYVKPSGTERTHQIHAFQVGHIEIVRLLDLRDYLRKHPMEAEAYGRLKADLAKKFEEDIDSYVQGKGEFIQDIYRKAAEWRKEQNQK